MHVVYFVTNSQHFKLQQGEALFFPKSVCVRMCPCKDGDGLVAATSSDNHVAVFLENDV